MDEMRLSSAHARDGARRGRGACFLACRMLGGLVLSLLTLATVVAALLVLSFDVHHPWSSEYDAALPDDLRPSRPIAIRVLNAANVAFKHIVGVELVPLKAEALIKAACDKFTAERPATAGCDFGDAPSEYGSFRDGLEVFVRSLQDEGRLTFIGRIFAAVRISHLLDQRLRLIEYWHSKEHRSTVAQTTVDAPVFIVGHNSP